MGNLKDVLIKEYVEEWIDDACLVRDCERFDEYVSVMKDDLLINMNDHFEDEIKWDDIEEDVRLGYLDYLREEWDLWCNR